jgi:hypothetical protein
MTTKNSPYWDSEIVLSIVLIYIAAVSALIIYDHDLWNPHKHRAGAIVKEMRDSGNLIVPTLNGKPFLQKPLLYNVTALFLIKLFKGQPARTFRKNPEELGKQVPGSIPVGRDRHIYVLRLETPPKLRSQLDGKI